MLEAIRQIKRALAGRVPLIGFAGAPFTLASYAIEGGHSSNFAHTKSLMYGAPAAWHRFCDTLADVIGDYLVAQIDAGVDAVQVFDSWVGALNAPDYREFILPHTKQIFERRARAATRRADDSLRRRHRVDSRPSCATPAATSSAPTGARRSTKPGSASAPIAPIQGNLDPTLLLGPLDRIFAATDDVLARAGGRPGHIFNLGHGILPSTPVEHVQALARYVHQKTQSVMPRAQPC